MKNRGLRVKKLRKEHRDTLKELAEKIGYDYSNLSKIERGVYKGTIDVFDKIAKVYGVDISYFSYSEDDLKEFTKNEQDLIFERTLSLETIKEKYVNLDGKPLTDKQIEDILKYARFIQQNEESS